MQNHRNITVGVLALCLIGGLTGCVRNPAYQDMPDKVVVSGTLKHFGAATTGASTTAPTRHTETTGVVSTTELIPAPTSGTTTRLMTKKIQNDTVKASHITFPAFGDRLGIVTITGRSVNAPLFFGDSDVELTNGVGQYNGSLFPGCGSTVLIGGHNYGYFHGLQDVQIGDLVTLNVSYGVYTYRVTQTAVHDIYDDTAYNLGADRDNLVLYTCYPFDTREATPLRYFVYADYIAGPRVLLTQ